MTLKEIKKNNLMVLIDTLETWAYSDGLLTKHRSLQRRTQAVKERDTIRLKIREALDEI